MQRFIWQEKKKKAGHGRSYALGKISLDEKSQQKPGILAARLQVNLSIHALTQTYKPRKSYVLRKRENTDSYKITLLILT